MNGVSMELEQIDAELESVESAIQDLLTRQSSLLERKEQLQAVKAEQDVEELENCIKIWDSCDFPWTDELDKKLKEVFKLDELRPMQRQTMNATLDKKDTLLIMPTGGGKSLCFQLPAVVDKGLTLVVSPLISLMEDQQMALEQLRVPSAMLNSATTKDDLKFVQDDMVNNNTKLKLLYVTPEKLAKSKRFMNRLEKCYAMGNLARIVIDEVHCCSQWGHDFRPDYKFLGIMKRQFPNSPILGLTATATSAVLDDVKKILNIPRALLFKASFNRPNLYYEVRQKPSSQKETMDEIYDLIYKRFSDQSGIVYCFSRKETEEVTKDLMTRGIQAGCYHADMDAQSRSRVHRLWLSGKMQVVVATVAFGMGIDKPDVRFVIHHSISKSMENLYQESGRAGRDDKRADCIVLYRLADVARQSSMVFTEQTGLSNLHGIVRYCIDAKRCRRSVLADHFGEVWESSHCNNMCDHCKYNNIKGSSKSMEVTKYCQDVITLLELAASTEQRVTSAKIIDSWYGRGSSTLRVKSVTVPPIDKDTAERILAHMLVEGYIREDFHFTAYSTICYIVQGGKARVLRNNTSKVFLDFRCKSNTPRKNKDVAKPTDKSNSIGSGAKQSSKKRSPAAESKSRSNEKVDSNLTYKVKRALDSDSPMINTETRVNHGTDAQPFVSHGGTIDQDETIKSEKKRKMSLKSSLTTSVKEKQNTPCKDLENQSLKKTMHDHKDERVKEEHEAEMSHLPIKRVCSDDGSDDSDFDIVRPRKSRKCEKPAIIISDDSDSAG